MRGGNVIVKRGNGVRSSERRLDRRELDTLEERDARVSAIIEQVRHHLSEPAASGRRTPSASSRRRSGAPADRR